MPAFRIPRLLFIVPVLLAGLALVLTIGKSVEVVAVAPVRGKAVEAVYATGTVDAVNTSRVGAPMAGRVVDVLADVGDRVEKGGPLAVMDDEKAVQRVDDARARHDLAQKEFERQSILVRRSFTTRQNLQRAETELQQSKAALEQTEKDLRDLSILSPIDGAVIERNVDPGQSVPANTALFTVASTRKLRIIADVDERDIPRVRKGARVVATSEAFPGESFESRVDVVRAVGDVATRTWRVDSGLPPDTRLMAGMTVDVNIVLAEHEDALLLPVSAVMRAAPAGGALGAASVWKIKNGRLKRQKVKLGAVGPEKAEVVEGVDEKDVVALKPSLDWKDGAPVRIVKNGGPRLNVFNPPTP